MFNLQHDVSDESDDDHGDGDVDAGKRAEEGGHEKGGSHGEAAPHPFHRERRVRSHGEHGGDKGCGTHRQHE